MNTTKKGMKAAAPDEQLIQLITISEDGGIYIPAALNKRIEEAGSDPNKVIAEWIRDEIKAHQK